MEAKINLGIEGYPAKEQEPMLVAEATRIFEERPEHIRNAMRSMKCELDSVKMPKGSLSSRSTCSMEASNHSIISCESEDCLSKTGFRLFSRR